MLSAVLTRSLSLATALLLSAASFAQIAPTPSSPPAPTTPSSAWLFAGFKGNGQFGVVFAISRDGYHWQLVNAGQPVVPPTAPGELMRDPFLQRAPDGSVRMVWTWAWYDPANIGYSESTDLVHWTPHRELPVMAAQPGARNVWAPALYYEPDRHRWLILWASTIPGRFSGDTSGDNGLNHRIFSTTTTDFATFTPARLFFDPGYSVIDATILPPQSPSAPFTMIFKDERKTPLEKHLLTATGPSFEGPWSNISQPISEPWSEGAAIIPVAAIDDSPAGYLAYYDHYTQGQHYGALFSTDLVHWTDALSRISFPPGMRHGSFLRITPAEYDRLAALMPAPVDAAAPAPASQTAKVAALKESAR
ncbi:MAG TPA: glycoside hydrolase family 43 protein [Acidobacteriaceae bacterium]|nr:glycoside hydrolase family 43 protein [Acidobacteriaceae bacterium]